MVIWSYKLKRDLTGRVASQLNWELNEIPHQIFLRIHDGRIINGKSLIGVLSGRFVKGDVIEIATQTQDEQVNVERAILKLDLAIKIDDKGLF